MTQEVTKTEEFEPILHHYIQAGFRLVLSDVTFMTVAISGTVFIAIMLIVVDYFNRRGRRY